MSADLPDKMNRQLEELIKAGLYKSKSEAMRDALRRLFGDYREYLRPIEEVRRATATIPNTEEISREVIRTRRKEVARLQRA